MSPTAAESSAALPPPLPGGPWSGALPHHVEPAWERVGLPGRWSFTCEHASNRVPPPWQAAPADEPWLRTHWGYDIGARAVTVELVRRLGGAAVLSRASRLVCDVNRAPDHPDLVRQELEGHVVSFNAHLGQDEIDRRVAAWHAPYHEACDALLGRARAEAGARARLVSVHSFTPIWNMHVRSMDVGVLYDQHDDEAMALAEALRAEDLEVALNEPYSGKEGLIYSAARHGEAHDVPYVELELNQALVSTPARAERMAGRLHRALLRAYGT